MRIFKSSLLSGLFIVCAGNAFAGGAIFFHPDGMGVNTWGIIRNQKVGADSSLNWDLLPNIAVYKGHMSDKPVATSNGGATSHAYGIKVPAKSYGILDTDKKSIAHDALAAGKAVALINSGSIIEPGTGAFVARTTNRESYEAIAEQVLFSGARIILSGGEEWLLPEHVNGRHGAGKRTDGRNLIEEAQKSGFTIIYDAKELNATNPKTTRKLLGVFASEHSFNDMSPTKLLLSQKPLYSESAPTIAEMTTKALQILQSQQPDNFLIIAEEEGTDNFGNKQNAAGVIEAGKRADDAIGAILTFIKLHPETTMFTTSDSDAGGLQLRTSGKVKFVSHEDVAGGIVIRAAGKHASQVKGTMDNTVIYDLLKAALFDD